MKKKILICLLVLGLSAGCGKVATLSNGEDAVVTFDDSKLGISANQLYESIKDSTLGNLIELIDTNVLLDKYPDKDKDAKEYVDEQFELIKNNYKDDNGKFDEDALKNDIYQAYGYSDIERFKNVIKLSYYRNLAVDDFAKEKISDKEIEKYYNENIAGDISCKHILITADVKDDMTDKEKEKAEEKALSTAKEVIKKLKDGESFDDLAKKYSKDSSNADKGGDLGFFNKGEMVSEFEEAAYALKVGKYTTTPVKTKFGYHIILKTDEKEKPALDDKKDDIIETLVNELKSTDTALSVNALVELRKSYGMDIQDSELSKLYSTYISNQLLNTQSKK